VDEALLVRAKRYTNEQVVQKATNSPVEEISFDGGIYSVGNNVVNGQISVSLKGRSLKNELNYNRDTWAEWTTHPTGVIKDSSGISMTGGARYAYVPTKVKPLTKYGLLYNIVENSITEGGVRASNYLTGSYITLSSNLGNNTKTFITQEVISSNRFGIETISTTVGSIKIKDIRLFELPAGSEIEKDFDTTVQGATNLTADQLAQKYPYINGDSVKSTNSVRVKSVGKNLVNYKNITDRGAGSVTIIENGIEYEGNYYFVVPVSNLKIGQPYVMSWTAEQISGGVAISPHYRFAYTDGTNSSQAVSGQTLTPSKAVQEIMLYSKISDDALKTRYTDIQLEQGSTATPYEPYKESIVNVNLPEPLRSVPSANDEINVTTGKATIRIGHKTDVASGTVINYVDMADGGQYYAWNNDGETETGIKGDTLEIDATSLTYQLATPIVTKLPAQAPLQVFENGTVYAEPIGDPSETTLPTVELTVPIGAPNKFGSASHDYEGAAADWVLNDSEQKCLILVATNSGGNANIILPKKSGLVYLVDNKTDYNIVCKSVGDVAGTTILSGNSGLIYNI
jgi:hypothetical protein